jgi:pyruvate-ferredoxin/flavodoxin oxidoreductase
MSKKLTIDGNTAAAHVAYAFSDVAAIYPITPSTPMAEICDEWAAQGRKNLFGQTLKIAEMQSEAGAAGAVHGSLAAGAFTTTFTASQGLLLMIPNMYKIAGELLPSVIHVAARSLAAHALSIFGDHADVYACRQTGFAMLCSGSVQEAHDLALVSHLSTLESRIPFLHFFDGFRTSHEINKIDVLSYEELAPLLNRQKVREFRERALNPEHPHAQGTAQNPDTYFQNREAGNKFYDALPAIVKQAMDKVAALTGRKYNLFDYAGANDAENIIILMGSGAECAEETVRYLNAAGEKTGVVKVRLYRPFDAAALLKAIPKTVKYITVLDRTKEPGSAGEPLYKDVLTALAENGKNNIGLLAGRYGLGSKEFTPTDVKAVFDNAKAQKPKNHFTVGIEDDLTNLSLKAGKKIDAAPKGSVSCKFYGLGSDGTVGANKNSIKIIGDHTDLFAQGYFEYDSKKSGGITISHLRFGKNQIKSTYLVTQSDFLACSFSAYITKYDMLSDLKDGGVFLLNSPWSAADMEAQLPAAVKNQIAKKKLKFYNIDAAKIATESGSGKSANMVMQAAFFKLSNVIPYGEAEVYMKDAILKTYGKKGDRIVAMNNAAIDGAISGITQINYPADWLTAAKGKAPDTLKGDKYFEEFVKPIILQKGNDLPVSAFSPDGRVPTGTAAYEKRGIALSVPQWIPENCIQCNQCSLVCPHAVIRPILTDAATTKKAPPSYKTLKAAGADGLNFRIQLSPLDCTGCGVCINACPAKQKALVNAPLEQSVRLETKNYEFSQTVPAVETQFKKDTVKGSQFLKPLFEFSGACAGCGETPYIKLISQLFGERLLVANATGCSSIYSGSSPSTPYAKNGDGHGPAWANSLFEDNAEFGFGMLIAYSQRRAKLSDVVDKILELGTTASLKDALISWRENKNSFDLTKAAAAKIKDLLPQAIKDAGGANGAGKGGAAGAAATDGLGGLLSELSKSSDMLTKKSLWLIGGDGWAYDIGYGGLDHVLSLGEDINVLVVDTEVYSNTGGQASKSSPTGAVAKFAASGKKTKKKDLGMMFMSYGYVYVAQVALGANMNQTVKAISEAEAYYGPSIVIAYAPCINHGIDMSKSQQEIKRAVDCGYWSTYRYNPALLDEGKNPFVLDGAAPTEDYQAYLMGETRYSALTKTAPESAAKLFKRSEKEARDRIEKYVKLSKN